MIIEIKDFLPADKQVYIDFSKQFYNSSAVDHTIPVENFSTTFDAIINKSPFIRGVMLLYNSERVGYALLSFTYSNEAGGLVVLLEEIFVTEEFQGRGILREAFKKLEAEYSSAARFRLEVTVENERAISIYRKYGYKPLEYVQMIKDN